MKMRVEQDWQPWSSAPLEEIGSFLVYIPDSSSGRVYEVCHVHKIANGFMQIIGGHFHFDAEAEPTLWKPITPPESP
jgi:hypothetical protein